MYPYQKPIANEIYYGLIKKKKANNNNKYKAKAVSLGI